MVWIHGANLLPILNVFIVVVISTYSNRNFTIKCRKKSKYSSPKKSSLVSKFIKIIRFKRII